MASVNRKKFGLTCLFPIIREDRTHSLQLRAHLRTMDSDPYGSPLSRVPIIHMARFAIIGDLPYQGVPNNRDDLLSDYMLFVCDFDGTNVDTLVAAMITNIAKEVVEAFGALRCLSWSWEQRCSHRLFRTMPTTDQPFLG